MIGTLDSIKNSSNRARIFNKKISLSKVNSPTNASNYAFSIDNSYYL